MTLSSVFDNSIVDGVIASAAWVGILGFGFYLYAKARLRRWWRIGRPRGAIVRFVTGTLNTQTSPYGYSYSVTTLPDAAGVAEATAGLTLAWGRRYRVRVYSSAVFHQSFWDDVVVLIGGRVRNKVTRELFLRLDEDWDLPYSIEDAIVNQTRTITDKRTGQTFAAQFTEEGHISRDYGLLCRLPNPYAHGRRKSPIFVFYGLHAFGILGTAKMVSTERFPEIRDALRNDWCMLLVAVDVGDEDVYPEYLGYGVAKSLR